MDGIENLSLLNLDKFKKIYNKNILSFICSKNFFELYNKKNFIMKFFLRRQIKLFKFKNKYIGYIWSTPAIKQKSGIIYSLYFLPGFPEAFMPGYIKALPYKELNFKIKSSPEIQKIMQNLNFTIESTVNFMKLNHPAVVLDFPESPDIEFYHFQADEDEELRCHVQNEIFFEKSRVPLTIEDIYDEEDQDYYIEDFSVFLKIKGHVVGYGQIILSNEKYVIANFGILKQYRRKGYAKLLLIYLINLCYKNSINDIYIQVDKTNIPAIELYKSIGFENCVTYDIWTKENN